MTNRRRGDAESFDGRPIRNDSVAVTGPGGWGIKVGGRDTILIILLAAALAWLVWSSRQEHRAIVDELSTVSYLMSLKPDERPRLAAPSHLQKRIDSNGPHGRP